MARYAHGRAFLNRDYPAAAATFELALDNSPNSADVWMWRSCTYAYLGDGPEAIPRAELGLRLSSRAKSEWTGLESAPRTGPKPQPTPKGEYTPNSSTRHGRA